ncbi:MAG: hypothetical protein A2171_02165 [Candidatus Levybacteria bacterium RBG_13_35_9]|nr:MAG: hypothetical protein A2171_02165 [Candidatus Levybacteria bacterium RBG_13_35_9]
MKARIILIAFFLFGIFSWRVLPAFASLYINELSSGTSDSDWVEIYNSDSAPVDLSLYILRDGTDTNKIDLSGNIEANGFAVFDWSNKLNNSGDTIRLILNSDSSTIDTVSYGDSGGIIAPQDTQTAGRTPDGSSGIFLLSSSTKGSSNNSSSIVPTATQTPTEAPTPTKTPTPTKSPTPTPTIKPTSTSVPTKTPTPKPTITNSISTPTPLSENRNNSVSVLGSSAQNQIPTLSEEKKEVKVESVNSGNIIAKVFIILGLIFLILCGIVIFLSYKKSKDAKNEE